MYKFIILLAMTLSQFAWSQELFPEALLKDYLKWESVLPNQGEFKSAGHGGVLVRAYFNEVAKPTYTKETAIPFSEGAVVAKAVIASAQTPSSAATRVYFMKKMNQDYDPKNSNWAYAFADLVDGKYVYNSAQGKVGLCIKCHAAQAKFDYVQTLKLYSESHF